MDPRLLQHYERELGHLREMGAEFAEQFPKIAGRLGFDGIQVADPYVERLLEGFAFLAARVQLKLDAEFPHFTERLLEILYPQFLAPTPSMLVARFEVDVDDPGLAGGAPVPRGSALHSLHGNGDTACEFRTAHELQLWPLRISACSYFSHAPDLPLAGLRLAPGLDGALVKGGLRLRLQLGGGLRFDQLGLQHLPLHFSGADDVAFKLHELALGACLGMLVLPPQRPARCCEFVEADAVRPLGFADDEALLPVSLRSFQGYRLLQEYAAFPQRFLFVDLHGLGRPLARCGGDEVEIVLLFGRGEPGLEGRVGTDSVALHCTPAINLFPKRLDRVHLAAGGPQQHEHHVVPDRTRPMDYEVYALDAVSGHGSGAQPLQQFWPFYSARHGGAPGHAAYYTLRREPRLLSAAQQRHGARAGYVGSEVFLSLVDGDEAPYGDELAQLSISALVTNRDLPLLMPQGGPRGDFLLDASAPVAAVRTLRGPSRPYSALRAGNIAWRFINHLSLNHLSLCDDDDDEARGAHAAAVGNGAPPGRGTAALRDMLGLYGVVGDAALLRQVEGLKRVATRPLVRRLPLPGPIAFGRGIEIELEVDELAFQGASPFLFGAVLAQFMARHVSLNSFVETVLRSSSRGELMRWEPRCGSRSIL